jgi:hypothetical protein
MLAATMRTAAVHADSPDRLSLRVKLVYLVLAANGVPALVLLTVAAGHTADLFVWTVKPEASAQMLGVMYANALILVLLGLAQPSWARARVTMVLIVVFSISATIVTLFNLDPFLKHPWIHLAYWLSMYAALVIAAPLTFVLEEREHGGRLPVEQPLGALPRAVGALGIVGLGALGLALLIDPAAVNHSWPWMLSPLVGRLLGVWFGSLAVAYAWALTDGDWLRARPIFLQGPPTGALLLLVPALRGGELRSGVAHLGVFIALVAFLLGGGLLACLAGERDRSHAAL